MVSPWLFLPVRSSSISEILSTIFSDSDTPVSISAITLSSLFAATESSAVFSAAIALLSVSDGMLSHAFSEAFSVAASTIASGSTASAFSL